MRLSVRLPQRVAECSRSAPPQTARRTWAIGALGDDRAEVDC